MKTWSFSVFFGNVLDAVVIQKWIGFISDGRAKRAVSLYVNVVFSTKLDQVWLRIVRVDFNLRKNQWRHWFNKTLSFQ